MGRYAGRSGGRMRALQKQIRATETHCYRCGQPIDWTIPYRDQHGNLNDMAGSVEHKQPLSKYPHLAEDPGNLGASHSLCNRAAGNNENRPAMGVLTQDW
jgi:5-methylcytosine-specific restriction endonuclease McrA